jgi:hypothetical protein
MTIYVVLQESRMSYADPNTKSVIYPLLVKPNDRNIRRCDPVSRYHQFRQCWDAQKAPGEKAHKSLRWNMREHMLYHDEVVKVRNITHYLKVFCTQGNFIFPSNFIN